MIEEAFGYKVPQDIFESVLQNYYKLDNLLINYKGTNIKSANILLNDIMTIEEKKVLEEAFFGDNGWYRAINREGMIKLKLAAMSLGVTNNVFSFNKDIETKILNFICSESREEQILMMRCYIKQKVATYTTMYN